MRTWLEFNPEMLNTIFGTKNDGICIWIENEPSPVYFSSDVFNFNFEHVKNSPSIKFFNDNSSQIEWNTNYLHKLLFSGNQHSFNYQIETESKNSTYSVKNKVYINEKDLLCIVFYAKISHNSDFISLKNPKLFYELFDSSEELIGITNLLGKFTAVNKKWIEKTGYTKEELKNTNLLRLVHKDDITETYNEFKKLYRKESRVINCQSKIYHKNGSIIWLEWNAVYDAELSSIYTVARDITQKKNLTIFREQSSKVLIDLSAKSNLKHYKYKDFLNYLVIKTLNLLNVDRFSIWSYESNKNTLIRKYFLQKGSSKVECNAVTLLESDLPIYFKSIIENKTLSVVDAKNDIRTSEFTTDYLIPNNIHSLLDVQIRGESGLVGIVCAEQCNSIRMWNDEEANFMYSLSEIISRAISNNQLLQSQKRLNETIDQLNLTIEAARLGLWELDNSGKLTTNNQLAEIFEITNNSEIKNLDIFSQHVLPDDLALIKKLFNTDVENIEINNYRYRIITPNKKLKYLLGFAKRVNDENGVFIKWSGVAIDITELTQSQLALKENEERLQFTLDSINDLIMILDVNGIFIEFYIPNTIPNWIFKDPLGFVGKHYSQLNSDSFKLHLDHLYSDYKEFSDYKQFDYKLEQKDFSVWFGANASIRYNSEGEFAGITVVSRDVSVRKAIEAALNDEKNRVLAIIEGTNVGTWQWNIQSGETEFNERWAAIIGYSLNELGSTSKETWAALCHPGDLKKSTELFKQHFLGKSEYYHIETRMRHKNGQWVWVLARGKVSEWDKEGKPLLMYGTHQDITIRKYTELAMIKLSNELAPLNGIELLNETCKYLADTLSFDCAYVGKADDGFTQIETLNMYNNGLFTEPITYSLANTPCQNVVAGDKCLIDDGVAGLFPKDTSLSDMRIKAYAGIPLLDKNGRVKGLIVLLSKKPIVSMSLVDSILSVYRSKISAELDRIEAEEKLDVLLDTTKRQNDRLRHFSFITSHNIRSSVSNILGLTDILGESLEMADSMIPLLSIATKSLDTSLKNANQLLQLEEKLDTNELSECNLNSFVSNILAQLKQRLEEKNIEINIEIDQSFSIFTNPAYIESILYNLISNACKYGINEKNKLIIIRGYHNQEGSYIEIQDFGNGLENQRDIARIFELGTRLHNTEDGQGFGLFMIKHQVEILGGTITVISEKDQGALFKVHLNH